MQLQLKQSTKQCPNCGNTHLILLSTYNTKVCADCNTTIPWFLDEGQSPLYAKLQRKQKEIR